MSTILRTASSTTQLLRLESDDFSKFTTPAPICFQLVETPKYPALPVRPSQRLFSWWLPTSMTRVWLHITMRGIVGCFSLSSLPVSKFSVHCVEPKTSTKKLNGARCFKHIVNGTSTNSPGASAPSENSPVSCTVTIAPTPPGPPSAFCKRLPLVKVLTSVISLESGLSLMFLSVAVKAEFPNKARWTTGGDGSCLVG